MAEKNLTKEFIAERDAQIFKLRQGGATLTEISKRYEISEAAAGKAVKRQLERIGRDSFLSFPEALQMELERLDSLMSSFWGMTKHRIVEIDGQEIVVDPDPDAAKLVLSLMDRRHKLLGLDQARTHVHEIDVGQNLRAILAGSGEEVALERVNPRDEAIALLKLAGESRVMDKDIIDQLLDGEDLGELEAGGETSG